MKLLSGVKITALCLIFSFLLPIALAAKENRDLCPAINTEVNIDNQVKPERIKYDYSKTIDDLTRETKKGVKKKSWDGGKRTLGLYSGDVHFDKKVTADLEDGCIKTVHIDIVIGYNPVIYLSKDQLYSYAKRRHDIVLWHEREHAQIDIENYKRYLPYLKQELIRYVGKFQMPKAGTQEELIKSRDSALKDIEQVILKNLYHAYYTIGRLQGKFDREQYIMNVGHFSPYKNNVNRDREWLKKHNIGFRRYKKEDKEEYSLEFKE